MPRAGEGLCAMGEGRRILSTVPTLILAASCAVVGAGPPSGETPWAFGPLRRAEVPTVAHPERARNPIDAFLLRNLDANGIEPAPEADRRTLIRRLFFD